MNAPSEPVFTEPWHAQVFAMTVHLNETGRLDWTDWAAAFSATLKRRGLSRSLDGGEDNFSAWLETLEAVVVRDGHADREDLRTLKEAWRRAYEDTSHGQPVRLSGGA